MIWRQQMTNEEKLKEIFPEIIFIRLMKENKTQALVVTDEWLNAEYLEPPKESEESGV
jgi:hypothetical protein